MDLFELFFKKDEPTTLPKYSINFVPNVVMRVSASIIFVGMTSLESTDSTILESGNFFSVCETRDST